MMYANWSKNLKEVWNKVNMAKLTPFFINEKHKHFVKENEMVIAGDDEKNVTECSYCGLEKDQLWTTKDGDGICIDCITEGMDFAERKLELRAVTPNYYKKAMEIAQGHNILYLKSRDEWKERCMTSEKRAGNLERDHAATQCTIERWKARTKDFKKQCDDYKRDSVVWQNQTNGIHMAKICKLEEELKTANDTIANIAELKTRGIAELKAKVEKWQQRATELKLTANQTIASMVKLNVSVYNKDIKIKSMEKTMAAMTLAKDVLDDVPLTPIPSRNANTISVTDEQAAAVREAGNICPACKKINHSRSAKNNPLGLCQECFQAKRVEEEQDVKENGKWPYINYCPACKKQNFTALRHTKGQLCSKCVEVKDMAADLISKPNHYNWHPSGIECKDVVGAFCYNKGTAIAYIWRSEHKGTEEADIKKAIQHLQFELDGMGDDE